eukprot:gene16029-8694_t
MRGIGYTSRDLRGQLDADWAKLIAPVARWSDAAPPLRQGAPAPSLYAVAADRRATPTTIRLTT